MNPLTRAILDEDVGAMKAIIGSIEKKPMSLARGKVKAVRKVESAGDQYVYDIGMRNNDHPWFFANNILVHNSVYFSAYPALKEQIDAGKINWSKENIIKLYDNVSEEVSDTFPQFLEETFNIPRKNGEVIRSAREIVAKSGLFIKKKRYAALMIDKDGKRQDINGKEGKIKVTGLDLRRSDTPKYVQAFLLGILSKLLHGVGEDEIITDIRTFKDEFSKKNPWEKGVPKAVNNLTSYKEREAEQLKQKFSGYKPKTLTVPGHVRGSLNWNHLRDTNNDLHTMKILDGSKIILCYLKETSDNKMTNMCYPVDENHLPEWFTKLPFDEKKMEESVIDSKVQNLLGVLGWDLTRTSRDAVLFENLFNFGD